MNSPDALGTPSPARAVQPVAAVTPADQTWGPDIVALMPSLKIFARFLCKDRIMADDMVQDTLVKAWTNRAGFQPGTNLKAWLFTILRNNFYSALRRRRWEIQDVDGLHAGARSSEPNQEWAATARALERALHTLPDRQRQAVLLVGAAGYSYEDVAKSCGCALGTIKSRVSRGRSRLAELMG